MTARVRVEDLDAAVDFYEQLTGATGRRFEFAGARLAAVGPFLLFAAEGELGDRLAGVRATVSVGDVAVACDKIVELGGVVIAPPAATPNGHRAVTRHPDGSVFEYVGP